MKAFLLVAVAAVVIIAASVIVAVLLISDNGTEAPPAPAGIGTNATNVSHNRSNIFDPPSSLSSPTTRPSVQGPLFSHPTFFPDDAPLDTTNTDFPYPYCYQEMKHAIQTYGDYDTGGGLSPLYQSQFRHVQYSTPPDRIAQSYQDGTSGIVAWRRSVVASYYTAFNQTVANTTRSHQIYWMNVAFPKRDYGWVHPPPGTFVDWRKVIADDSGTGIFLARLELEDPRLSQSYTDTSRSETTDTSSTVTASTTRQDATKDVKKASWVVWGMVGGTFSSHSNNNKDCVKDMNHHLSVALEQEQIESTDQIETFLATRDCDFAILTKARSLTSTTATVSFSTSRTAGISHTGNNRHRKIISWLNTEHGLEKEGLEPGSIWRDQYQQNASTPVMILPFQTQQQRHHAEVTPLLLKYSWECGFIALTRRSDDNSNNSRDNRTTMVSWGASPPGRCSYFQSDSEDPTSTSKTDVDITNNDALIDVRQLELIRDGVALVGNADGRLVLYGTSNLNPYNPKSGYQRPDSIKRENWEAFQRAIQTGGGVSQLQATASGIVFVRLVNRTWIAYDQFGFFDATRSYHDDDDDEFDTFENTRNNIRTFRGLSSVILWNERKNHLFPLAGFHIKDHFQHLEPGNNTSWIIRQIVASDEGFAVWCQRDGIGERVFLGGVEYKSNTFYQANATSKIGMVSPVVGIYTSPWSSRQFGVLHANDCFATFSRPWDTESGRIDAINTICNIDEILTPGPYGFRVLLKDGSVVVAPQGILDKLRMPSPFSGSWITPPHYGAGLTSRGWIISPELSPYGYCETSERGPEEVTVFRYNQDSFGALYCAHSESLHCCDPGWEFTVFGASSAVFRQNQSWMIAKNSQNVDDCLVNVHGMQDTYLFEFTSRANATSLERKFVWPNEWGSTGLAMSNTSEYSGTHHYGGLRILGMYPTRPKFDSSAGAGVALLAENGMISILDGKFPYVRLSELQEPLLASPVVSLALSPRYACVIREHNQTLSMFARQSGKAPLILKSGYEAVYTVGFSDTFLSVQSNGTIVVILGSSTTLQSTGINTAEVLAEDPAGDWSLIYLPLRDKSGIVRVELPFKGVPVVTRIELPYATWSVSPNGKAFALLANANETTSVWASGFLVGGLSFRVSSVIFGFARIGLVGRDPFVAISSDQSWLAYCSPPPIGLENGNLMDGCKEYQIANKIESVEAINSYEFAILDQVGNVWVLEDWGGKMRLLTLNGKANFMQSNGKAIWIRTAGKSAR